MGGVSLLGLLGVLFIAFKIAEIITWSWWLVLAPLWVPAVIAIALLLVAAAFGGRKL